MEMPIFEAIYQGQVKGRLALFMDNAYQPAFYSFHLGFVGAGTIGDMLEANEDCFWKWSQYVSLPDGVRLLRVYYSFRRHAWVLIIESDHLPPAKYIDIEFDHATYTAQAKDGKVFISNIQPNTQTMSIQSLTL